MELLVVMNVMVVVVSSLVVVFVVRGRFRRTATATAVAHTPATTVVVVAAARGVLVAVATLLGILLDLDVLADEPGYLVRVLSLEPRDTRLHQVTWDSGKTVSKLCTLV